MTQYNKEYNSLFAVYWTLTNHQRNCLLTTNVWRVHNQKEPILIPPGEDDKIKSGFYSFTPVTNTEMSFLDQISNTSDREPKIPQPRFSFFNPPISNTLPAKTITLAECARLIQLPYPYQDNTIKLRSLDMPDERKRFKTQSLAYVCFSGIFSRRADSGLKNPSGLIVIDLDHLPDPEALKHNLKIDDTLNPVMIFISPSGDGLKVIIAIDLQNGTHSEYFDAISNYLHLQYSLIADPSGRDISRACFLCHDSKLFLHPEYNDWR
jgi:hypothetical protein